MKGIAQHKISSFSLSMSSFLTIYMHCNRVLSLFLPPQNRFIPLLVVWFFPLIPPSLLSLPLLFLVVFQGRQVSSWQWPTAPVSSPAHPSKGSYHLRVLLLSTQRTSTTGNVGLKNKKNIHHFSLPILSFMLSTIPDWKVGLIEALSRDMIKLFWSYISSNEAIVNASNNHLTIYSPPSAGAGLH